MKHLVLAIVPILTATSTGCAHTAPPKAPATLAAAPPAPATTPVVAANDPPDAAPIFIEDDYAGALAKAKAARVPLFVDAWASWCHSCVSLRSFVFTDPRLAVETTHFVWLAIDTENPKNAAFIGKFPNSVLPTLRVLDPETERPLLVWEGTLTAPELVATLDEARGAAKKNAASEGRDLDASVMRLALANDAEGCAKAAKDALGKLRGTQRVDVAVTGASCAMGLPKDKIQAYLPPLVKELQAIVADPSLAILPDDRSGAYEALVDAGQASGEEVAVKENAVQWAAFLEGQAAQAKTPSERAVYDSHRLLAYLAMGRPEKAIPMLEATAKDFPDDFNPHARLARAYFELKKYDQAIVESDEALALAHGPRHVKIALGKADAQAAKRDKAGEKKTLEAALAFLATLPPAEAGPKLKAAIAGRIAKL